MAGSISTNSNVAALGAQRTLSQSTKALEQSLTRLASGLRINRASDDAAGLAVSQGLEVDSRIYAQGMRNINDAVSLTNIQESSLHELATITLRQHELAEQAANGVCSSAQRGAINAEASELTKEYNRIVNTAEFNGIKLFTGESRELRTQFGEGEDAAITFSLGGQSVSTSSPITPGSYLTISSATGKQYYVWFTVDGEGTDPAATAHGLRVDLYNEAQAQTTQFTLSTDGYGASTAPNQSFFTVTSGSKQYHVWFNTGGGTDPVQDGNGIEIDYTPTVPGVNASTTIWLANPSNGHYFVVNNYRLWFNTDGGGWDPNPEGPETSVMVNVQAYGGDTDAATLAALNGLSGISASGSSGSFCITDTTGGTLSIGDDGSGTVFGGGSFAPTPPVPGTSAETTAGWIAAALQATGDFTASSSGNVITATNVIAGAVTATDYGSSTGITVPFSGEAGGLDGATIATKIAAALNTTNAFTVSLDGSNLVITDKASGHAAALQDVNAHVIASSTVTPGTGSSVYSVGNSPRTLAFADFNEDGFADMATADYGGSTLSVLLGNGDGTFRARTTLLAGYYPASVIAVDLNNDSNIDLVSADYASSQLSVFLGQGDGTFQAQRTVAANGGVTAVTSGDFNHDGKVDLASVNYVSSGSAKVLVEFGRGDGTFQNPVNYDAGGYPTSIIAVDLNTDGNLDLVSTNYWNYNYVSVMMGNANGTFSARQTYSTGNWPFQVVAADLNHDNKPDLVTADYSSNCLSVLLNTGSGSFSPRSSLSLPGGPHFVTAADIDGDSNIDLIASYGNSAYGALFLGNANGTFQAPTSVHLVAGAFAVETEDLDLDGNQDLITTSLAEEGLVSVRLGEGGGTFESESQTSSDVTFESSGTATTTAVSLLVDDIDLTTQEGARAAMDVLDARLTDIDLQLGAIGAVQSRLDAAFRTVSSARENYTAASSQIRDVDVPEEAENLVKRRILQQAGAAILAQANQAPAIALRLLRGY